MNAEEQGKSDVDKSLLLTEEVRRGLEVEVSRGTGFVPRRQSLRKVKREGANKLSTWRTPLHQQLEHYPGRNPIGVQPGMADKPECSWASVVCQ